MESPLGVLNAGHRTRLSPCRDSSASWALTLTSSLSELSFTHHGIGQALNLQTAQRKVALWAVNSGAL